MLSLIPPSIACIKLIFRIGASLCLGGLILTAGSNGRAEEVPRLQVQAVKTAPVIDGKLDDDCWKNAQLADHFIQRNPVEGEPATQNTVVRVCFDEKNLYIAFRASDTEIEKLNHSVMQRDASVGADDYVFVVLDPFRRGKEGFYFRINANGALGEGKIDPRRGAPRMEWDALWDGASQIDDDGWSAEMVIPFRSLSFDPNEMNWGINFGRWMPRRQEQMRWTAASRNRGFFKLEDAGMLVGLQEVKKGLGIDVKPYFTNRYRNSKGGAGANEGYSFDPGGDVFYQITPNLTATLTFNTDFAEAEVDARRVNLTRFPLFFPEQRDFFLQGAEYFEFGGQRRSPLAFHSRTIGLSAGGKKVDVRAGGKVTGRIGKVGIGLLGVGLDSRGVLNKDQAYIGRFTYDVLKESQVGLIGSYGDPRTNGSNSLGGIDFLYKNRNWIGDNALEVYLWAMGSESDGQRGDSYGVRFDYTNTPFSFVVEFEQVDEAFRPAMGFVQRDGGVASNRMRYRFFPGQVWMQQLDVGYGASVFTSPDGDIETERFDVPSIDFETLRGDQFYIAPEFRREVLFEDFEIQEGIAIAPGDYLTKRLNFGFDTSSVRPFGFEMGFGIGEFYSGTRSRAMADAVWRASRFFRFNVGGSYNDINLDEGDFETIVASVGLRVTPNTRISWDSVVQYDNVSDEVGVNSRIRYIVKPGSDVYLVVNQGFDVEDGNFQQFSSEMVAKVGWTFRF